jgi:hypothetical protein
MSFRGFGYFLVTLLLVGCATKLTPAGEKVRIISDTQRADCDFVKLISYQVGLGPDKSGSALKGALNQAAEAGANSFYIITNNIHWADGATVSGEAFKCEGSH